MHYSQEEIGKRIKLERTKNNYSQEDIGYLLGQKSGAKQISKYESGTIPKLEVLLKLCDIFKCELGYILGEEDYSAGTKFNTTIENEIGLNVSSVAVLKYITGTTRDCISFGYESDSYRALINKFLSAKRFSELISKIYDLSESYNSFNGIWIDIEKKYGKDIFHKAYDYYYSSIDYLYDESAPVLEAIYYDAMRDISNAENKVQEYALTTKVCRYEAREEFERLLDEICPEQFS